MAEAFQASSPWTRYANVDDAEAPRDYVNHMDVVGSSDVVQAYKYQSFDLLAVKPGQQVLEVGCGPGTDAQVLARRVLPGGRVIAVDKSKTMIATAMERAHGLDLPLEFRQGDVYALEFPANSFDGCRADRVFHHLERCDDALAELVRVTRPGGRIVLSEPDFGSIVLSAADRELTRLVLNARCDEYASGWCGRELPGLFRRAGLTDLVVIPVPVTATDFAVPNEQWFGLSKLVDEMGAGGKLDPRRAAAWLRQLEESSAAGTFFCSILVFTVCGRKP